MARPALIVITGPTGVGKTDVAISVAQRLGAEIISADSRQIYRHIPICTAAPTAEQLALVPHHFVQMLELDAYYSAAQFEADAFAKIQELHARGYRYVVMCGGSMMYVDVVCRGIDDLPTISDAVRRDVALTFSRYGLEPLLEELQRLDPAYYAAIDRQNTKRVMHAVEICREAGVPYSSLRTGAAKPRPFDIVKIGLDLPREQLFERINRRVELMLDHGLLDELRPLLPLRHLNALNTVGCKEIFAYFDGTWDLPTAVARLQKNTRVYAKKQLTWYRRDPSITWLPPDPAAALSCILSD